MRVSGIVVGVAPEAFDEAVRALEGLAGIDVHQRDPQNARVVVTQDGASDAEHEQGLVRIQQLPHVRYAQLVYHYVDDDSEEDEE